MDSQQAKIVRAPLFPLYSELRACMRAWDGERVPAVREMITTIWSMTGTPQDPVDWSDPDAWIPARLAGEDRRLAQKLWTTSGRTANPRHVYGCYLLVSTQQLLAKAQDVYRIEDRGERFLNDDPEIIAEIDKVEGIPRLLALVSQKAQAKRGDLLPDWSNYLLQVSKFSKPSTFKDTLRRRLVNLVERGLLDRDGNSYSITSVGAAYLAQLGEPAPLQPTVPGNEIDVATALNAHNVKQREAMHSRLMALAPYAFEHFVKELLEAMDYENVEVTKQSGDKGVDVVANFQFGITEIKEVVQVKRTEQTITRPLIDQLRGALPYHGAIRGTLITLGRFAKGVEQSALFPGAAPITLIDGKRLLELVEKHGVGLRRKTLSMLEIDEAFFAEDEPAAEAEVDEVSI